MARDALASIPSEREVDVVLRSGRTVHVRPVRADDADAVHAFLDGLSLESRWFRFFSAGANLRVAAQMVTDVDYVDRYGIVGVDDGDIVAHGCYMRADAGAAEVAFAVADRLHGEGLATIMLAHLAEAAESAGIATLTALVLPGNHRMLEVFRDSGQPVEITSIPGAVRVELPASLSAAARERFADRDRIAAAAGVAHALAPVSVAVVGASDHPGSVGGAILANAVAAGFHGPLTAIHPHARCVAGMPAYRSLAAMPEPPELVVVAVPAARVADVARDAAAAGVAALVVVSAGFAESGPSGVERERELVAVCRGAGMRLVGPNCLGVVNTAPEVRLDATFAPRATPPGRVAFMSQSGALGIAVMDAARRRGLGLSCFVSAGNAADLAGNDFLEYWEQDEGTDVVLLYVESFGNPRRLGRIARRVASRKPVVAVKAGRSAAGRRAAASHTGALVAASDAAVDAVLQRAGVVRVDTLVELLDVGVLLGTQPPPAGPRVGIVTNGGGLGIMCADACATGGLDVVELSAGLRRTIRRGAPRHAAVGNPVDLTAGADPVAFGRAAGAVARSGEVDALVALFIAPHGADPAAYAAALHAEVGRAPADVTTVAAFMAVEPPEILTTGTRAIPCYDFPEDAARALARAARSGVVRVAATSAAATPEGVDADAAAALIAQALGRGVEWLAAEEAVGLMECYGIPTSACRAASDPDTAAAAAAALDGPVALKAVASGLVHKSDLGGVELNLPGADAVREAAVAMIRRLGEAGYRDVSFLVQQMAPRGVEMLVGVTNDASFGPLVVCGAGGTTAELTDDAAIRLAPLSEGEAAEMVADLRSFALMTGYRGSPPLDHPALTDVVERVAALAAAHEEVVEADLNPVVVLPSGVTAVDIRVRLEACPPGPPGPSLHGTWP
jgi:acyl-CoA synthetase (NDP forming)/GNAT superfamily N-acetyltransferase